MTDVRKPWLQAIEEQLAGLTDRFPDRHGRHDRHGRPGHGTPPAEIEGFERSHGVSLPEDYRKMLLVLGNGPPGLLPLHRWDDALMDAAPLAAPAILSPDKTFDDYEDDDEPAQGTIALTAGSPHAVLVVNGPHRGEVYYIDTDSYEVDLVEHVSGRPATVGEWYRAWLDVTAPGASSSSTRRLLGQGLVGDPNTLPTVLRDERFPPSRRAKALVSLTECPALDASTIAEVRRALESDDALIRAEALSCAARHDTDFLVSQLPVVLRSDPSPNVRRRALELVAGPSEARRKILEAVLDDPDDTLVFTALRQLLASSPSDVGQYARRNGVRRVDDATRLVLQHIADAGDVSCTDVVAEALDDPRAPVRLAAAHALRQLDYARWTKELTQRVTTDPDPKVRKRLEADLTNAQTMERPET